MLIIPKISVLFIEKHNIKQFLKKITEIGLNRDNKTKSIVLLNINEIITLIL